MKILLVDDNQYVLEGLRNGIDYGRLGFDEVYEARSMQGALSILTEQEIEVVLTDIEMPNGTGLELLEWLNAHRPETVTLFCTSYANFDYAKKAVELHSFDYYLKPIQYEELYQILERAVAEVQKRRSQREKESLGEYWIKNMAENKNQFWADALIHIFTYSEDELGELAESRHLCYRDGDCFTAALIRFTDEQTGISLLNYSMQQFVLKNILEELCVPEEAEVEGLFKSDKSLWTLVVASRSAGEPQLRELFERLIDSAVRYLKCGVTVCYYYRQPLSELRSRYLELEEAYTHARAEKNRVYSFGQLCPAEPDVGTAESDDVVERVKCYIETHFSEDITRESMGNLAYHNSAYLARIFKQKVGQSMSGYLVERRIEEAKRLLLETELSISEIAMAVGYDNFAYFSRLFKKKAGCTPKEYKKENAI